MPYQREKFEVCGVKLQMKPATAKNIERFRSLGDLENADEMSQGEQGILMLKHIADTVGDKTLDDIEKPDEELDLAEVQYWVRNFLPGLMSL